ncbi:DDE-type integrase/transposase/recombinase [Leisingera aquaemixtae]|uniref:hypothetical protein n=1 Tax=Leisingera aquaemixtae TaxID=1396826 RepID=UPI001C961E63|nr:hypothetical protein [Leisingera aquaemixtae]MBY6068823.1 DDE-type integrase/transposase/recombinase [Leisingera aquaemixtae]
MAAPFKKYRYLLEPRCRFRIGPRHAEVIEQREEGYLVLWEEWVDPDTGEVHERKPSMLTHERVANENNYGQLVVIQRPKVIVLDKQTIRRHWRTRDETSRMLVKKAHALAAEELIAEDMFQGRRAEFERFAELITSRARSIHAKLVAELGEPKARNGKRAVYGSLQRPEHQFKLKLRGGSNGGQSFYNWFRTWKSKGEDGLFDKYRNCGGNTPYPSELDDFVADIIDALVDRERLDFSALKDSVRAAIQAENSRRFSQTPPQPLLPMPGYSYVQKQARRMGYAAHAGRSHGIDDAYKDLHALGVGVETSRALERVEIDEYTIDLTLLMKITGLFEYLTPDEKKALGLDGGRRRVVISAAIDVHTRCLLALQIVPEGIADPLRQTLEMIYTDKSRISDELGCEHDWYQHGKVEELILDRAGKYISDEAYHILASLGITNLGAPAGKPWLKPFIERVFRTIHRKLLARFSGRNFSHPVERGSNDPAERATLTVEEFLSWLVRWTVDAYHNDRHSGLGITPLQAWERATADIRPHQLSNREMRLAFGTRVTRKSGRHGIRMMCLNYQTDFVIKRFLDKGPETAEICYWHGDVGAIEVRYDKGDWTTVTAADEEWIGKTDDDLREWLVERNEINPEAEEARLRLIHGLDKRSNRLKCLNKLYARPREAQDLANAETYFSQFTDTAERRHLAGPAEDLFAGKVQPAKAPHTLNADNGAAATTPQTSENPDDDLME